MTSSDLHTQRNWSKRLPLLLVFVASIMFLAFAAGGWIYATFMTPSRGMVGGAEVFMSGVLTAAGAGIASVILAWRMGIRRLLIVTLGTLAIAVVAGVLFFIRMQNIQKARKDPESAYSGIAIFRASVEQIVVSDPVLRVKIAVDSKKRLWISTGPAPKHQVCTGTVRAKALQAMSKALVKLARMDQIGLRSFFPDKSKATRRLTWKFEKTALVQGAPGLNGSLEFSDEQLKTAPEVAAAVAKIGAATFSNTSRVTCN